MLPEGRRFFVYICEAHSQTANWVNVVRNTIQHSAIQRDRTNQWYYLCWLCDQPVRQLFVVFDQVANVDVAVVFLKKRILAQLVSVLESANRISNGIVAYDRAYLYTKTLSSLNSRMKVSSCF